MLRQNLNILKIPYIYIIIQFFQTYLQIRSKNIFFFINFLINKDLKSQFKDYISNIYLIDKSNIKIKTSTFISLFYYVYVFTISQDITEVYLSSFFLLTGVLIKLIKTIDYWVNNDQLKKDFPIFHSIMKYILFSLFIIILLILIIIGQKLLTMVITYFKNLFLNLDLKKKFKDLKLSLDYKWFKNNGNKPNKPEETFFLNLNNKKKNKKKISSLKEKIFEAQRRNLNRNTSSTTFKQNSLSEKRNIKKSISIGNKPKFTISDQLKDVEYEFKAYDNQEKKFKKTVVDINKGKEGFYPNESKFLFNEYVSVIKVLKKNLKLVEKTLSKNKK